MVVGVVGAEQVLRAVRRRMRDLMYDSRHKRQALQILRNIEGANGRISRAELRKCDEYANSVLGDRRFAPWLYVYTAVSGRFKEGWIPDNYYGRVVVPKLNGKHGRISALKSLNFRLVSSPAFPDLLAYINGVFVDPAGRIVPPRQVEEILFADAERVVFKLDSSLQGRGVHVINRGSFDLAAVIKLGNGVFQKFVQQHPAFDEFVRSSVATLRITTFMDDRGNVSVRACYLRLGLAGETHVQSRSAVRVPVDLRNGELYDVGYTADWKMIDRHPSSGVPFRGKSVPQFEDCVTTVVSLHRKVPYVRCVGWDCTVDRNERVRVLEWNGGHNDIKFSEATQGPCFADLGWENLWRDE